MAVLVKRSSSIWALIRLRVSLYAVAGLLGLDLMLFSNQRKPRYPCACPLNASLNQSTIFKMLALKQSKIVVM